MSLWQKLWPSATPSSPKEEHESRDVERSEALQRSSNSKEEARSSHEAIRPIQRPSLCHAESATAEPESIVDLAAKEQGPVLSIPMTGFALGFCAGMYRYASRASLVFLAENAHRRPDTVQGWYFYNKTKNYKVLLAGMKGGIRTGTVLGSWTLGWVGLEMAMTRARLSFAPSETRQYPLRWLDGGLAGLGVASAASLLYRLSRPLSRKALIWGLLAGASVGQLRDFQQKLAEKREEQQA